MKIMMNEVSLLDKKLMNTKNVKSASLMDDPAPKAEYAINALEAQGMKNISFQSVAALKKPAIKALMAAGAIASVAMLQSCVKAEAIVYDNDEDLLAAFNALLDEMKDMKKQNSEENETMIALLQAILANQDLAAEERSNFMTMTLKFYNDYKSGSITYEEMMTEMKGLLQQLVDTTTLAYASMVEELKKNNELNETQINLLKSLLNSSLTQNEQNALIIAQGKEIMAEIANWHSEYANNEISEAEWRAHISDALAKITKLIDDSYKSMISELKQNNKDNKEIISQLETLNNKADLTNEQLAEQKATILAWYNDWKNNKITEAEWQANVLNLLKNIDANVADIKGLVSRLANSFDNFRKDYDKNNTNFNAKIDVLLANDEVKISLLRELNNNVAAMKNDLDSLAAGSDSLYNLVDKNHKELMEVLKDNTGSTSGISKADLEALLNKLGLTVTQAINMSKGDLLDAISDLKETYVTTEAAEVKNYTDLLKASNEKLDKIFSKLKEIEAGVSSATNTLSLKLGNVTAGIDSLAAVIRHAEQTDSLGHAATKKAIEDLDASQKIANSYLQLLKGKADDVVEILNQIKGKNTNVNGGMTIDELKAYMTERDSVNHVKYFDALKKLLKDFNLDKLAGDVATIKDATDGIEGYIDEIEGLLKNIKGLLNDIKNLDFTDPEVRAKLQAILEKLDNLKVECECKCNCGNGTHNHEGTDQDGGDNLDDLFSFNNTLNEILSNDGNYRIFDNNVFKA